MTLRPCYWRQIGLWILVVIGLYPAFSLFSLALSGLHRDWLIPGLMAHPSLKFLLMQLLNEWRFSFLDGAIMASVIIVIPQLCRRRCMTFIWVVILTNLVVAVFAYKLFGSFLLHSLPLFIYANLALVFHHQFIWRAWQVDE